MAATKRFYWMRFSKNFFQEHEIRIIESMPNGAKYLLFYIKLMAESVSHDGRLRCSEAIPYNEQMLAGITNTDLDVVHSAMEVLQQLDLVEIMDDKTLYMTKVAELIGSESESAERVRRFRAKDQIALHCNANVTDVTHNVTERIETRDNTTLSINSADYIIHKSGARPRVEEFGENGENSDGVKPDFREVLSFISGNHLRVDARRFRDYYDEKGWPEDWRAKAITWDSFYSASAAGKAEQREEFQALDEWAKAKGIK